MARGFYTTDGSGTTDRIATTYATHHTTTTYGMWVWLTGSGGGGFGRLLDKDRPGSGHIRITEVSLSTLNFTVAHSVAQGEWSTPIPSTGAWHHFAVTYDNSSTANDPILYVDGSSVTVTEVTTPSGTAGSSAVAYNLGNRDTGDRALNGRLAEMAIWSRILSAAEIAALGAGYAPSFITQGLAMYYPLLGRYSPENDRAIGGSSSGTVTGTAYQAHPRIIYPSGILTLVPPTSVSVALTGISSTGSAGSLVPSTAVPLGTVSSTGAVGSLTLSLGVPLTTLLATGAVGTLAPSLAVPLTTTLGTGSVGTLTTRLDFYASLTGVEATGGVGSLVPSLNVALISQTLTPSLGTLAPSNVLPITGSGATTSVGSLTVDFGIPATTVLATADAGSLTSSRAVPITGSEGTGGVGTVTGEIATIYQPITGVEATGAVGTPGVDVTIALSGILVSCVPGYLGSTGGTVVLPDYIYFHRPYVRQEGH